LGSTLVGSSMPFLAFATSSVTFLPFFFLSFLVPNEPQPKSSAGASGSGSGISVSSTYGMSVSIFQTIQ
jgi:hypothetical protein